MQDRIMELEVKIAYVENTVAELDTVVRSLGDRLDAMQRDLKTMREQLDEAQQDGPLNIKEEVPPHY